MIAASSSRVTEPAAASFSAEKQRVARRSMAAAAAMTLLKSRLACYLGRWACFPTRHIRDSILWARR